MIRRFLLDLTGVDQTLLARTRDQVKYERMGGAILFTAVFAAVSATVALHTGVHAPLLVALLFGVVWGVAILNLDSWIVSSTKRQPTFLGNVGLALPRLTIAVFLGFVISEPLVLQIFRAEINAELKVMQSEQQDSFEERMAESPRRQEAERTRQEIIDLQDQLAVGVPRDAMVNDPDVQAAKATLDRIDADLAAAERQLACEGQGSCGSGSPGAGPVFQENVARRDRLITEQRTAAQLYERAQEAARAALLSTADVRARDGAVRLATLEEQLRRSEEQLTSEKREHDLKVEASDGLLARMDALHRLSADKPTLEIARWLLFAFLLLIELTPVLLKLMQSLVKPGEYEVLASLEEEAALNRAATALWHEHLAHQKALELASVDQQTEVEQKALEQQAHLGLIALGQQAAYEEQRVAAEAALETVRLQAEAAAQIENDPHVRDSLTLWAQQEEARMEASLALEAARQKRKAELDASVRASKISLQAQIGVHHATVQEWKRQQETRVGPQIRDFIGPEDVPSQRRPAEAPANL